MMLDHTVGPFYVIQYLCGVGSGEGGGAQCARHYSKKLAARIANATALKHEVFS